MFGVEIENARQVLAGVIGLVWVLIMSGPYL